MGQGISKGLILILITGIFFTSCKSSQKSAARSKGVVKKAEDQPDASPSANCEKVVSIARSYIGTPYRFGGTTRAGMDCSGLMFTTFKSVNVTLPRTSEAQSQLGKKINLSDIQAGDLVFFTDRKGRSKVTHVGLVTEVKPGKLIKFIHSSTKLGVVESDLYAEYYYSVFLYAKRIL